MSENPFNFGRPVKGKDFYNRKAEIERAIGFIKNLQSFSIIGERRIGKTSLLEHVLSREVLEKYGVDPEKTAIVFLNMGGLHKVAKEVFIEAVLKQLREHTQVRKESSDVFEVLEAYIENLVSGGKKVIVAFDEFEIIASMLDEQLSSWLRHIFQGSNVMAITASQTTIGKLAKLGGTASPIFNIFGNLTLGLFLKDDSEHMIREMFQRGGIDLKREEISFLADLSGGNPYFIQFIGYDYYEKRKRDKELIENEFRDEMLYSLRDIFEGYWNHLSEEEKEFLFKIETSRNDQIAYTLKRKGFLIEEKDKKKIFSPLFQEFIMTKMKAFEEPEKTEERHRKKLPIWGVALISVLVAALLGVTSYYVIPDKWPDLFPKTKEILHHKVDFNLLLQLCSLIISILSFVISFVSLRRYSQPQRNEKEKTTIIKKKQKKQSDF